MTPIDNIPRAATPVTASPIAPPDAPERADDNAPARSLGLAARHRAPEALLDDRWLDAIDAATD